MKKEFTARVKALLLAMLLGVSLTATADIQINKANFPDDNFRKFLLWEDYGKDGVLTEEELRGITEMDLSNKNIFSLTGIEYFSALTQLFCNNNQLVALDVSKNTALKYLDCSDNHLAMLDVSKNTALLYLYCSRNQLGTSDVPTVNTETCTIYYGASMKRPADFSEIIGTGSSTEIHESIQMGQDPVTCVVNTTIEEKRKNKSHWIAIPTSMCRLSDWVDNLGSGKLHNFDDENYTAFHKETIIITNSDPTKTKEYTLYSMEFGAYYKNTSTITVARLVGSKNTTQTNLFGSNSQRPALDVSGCTALTELHCNQNQLAALDLSKNIVLKSLSCEKNQLTAIDLSKNTALESLSCPGNQLAALDLSTNTALTHLWCYNNKLTALDVSGCTALNCLYCFFNKLTALDLSTNIALESLYCSGNQFAALNLSTNTALTHLWCYDNKLTALDLSTNTALTELWCNGNHIQGASMDALVSSLPLNETTNAHRLYVLDETTGTESNVFTKKQVAVAKDKGWTPLHRDPKSGWDVYEGSDDEDTGITLPKQKNGESEIYNLAGQRVTTPKKGNVYIIGGKKVVAK